jgi:hypothetical protein
VDLPFKRAHINMGDSDQAQMNIALDSNREPLVGCNQ